jgi:hypothetical protein
MHMQPHMLGRCFIHDRTSSYAGRCAWYLGNLVHIACSNVVALVSIYTA